MCAHCTYPYLRIAGLAIWLLLLVVTGIRIRLKYAPGMERAYRAVYAVALALCAVAIGVQIALVALMGHGHGAALCIAVLILLLHLMLDRL